MFKKFLWLIVAVVFLCSPLWALEDNPWNKVLNDYLFASADQPQSSTPGQTELPQLKLQPSICSGPARESASPTDICSNTNDCFNQVFFCLPGGFLQPGFQVLSFQDPGKVCPPVVGCPVYPFEIKNVHVLLVECDPAGVGAVAVVAPVIYSADLSNPACPKPGNVICSGLEQQITIERLVCREYILPIAETCCVNGPYFAGIRVITPGTPNLSVCFDSTCTPCCNYFNPGIAFSEWCAMAPAPVGDFGIWTDGLYSCQNICPKADTLKNHFKTWRVSTTPLDTFAFVRDQFNLFDPNPLKLDSIHFLSNPVRKVVIGPTHNDTSDITRPDDHLTWYRARGNAASFKVVYSNQFETDTIYIDTVKYLLLPTQKTLPFHNPPDSLLGHYTAYKIRTPFEIFKKIELKDQFDVIPETITAIIRAYFLTPAEKNGEPTPASDTHYVAYEIFPKRFQTTFTETKDQFGFHGMGTQFSHLLLVPTKKIKFEPCTYKPNDCNGDGKVDLADIICDVNVVFKGFPKPVPGCRCDFNCDKSCTLVDIIAKKNYIFGGGPAPVPCRECCRPVK